MTTDAAPKKTPLWANDNVEHAAEPADEEKSSSAPPTRCCDANLRLRGQPCCMMGKEVVDVTEDNVGVAATTTAAASIVAASLHSSNATCRPWYFHVSPEVMRDIIIGLSDGLTVPFALTAGLSSTGSSHFVVLAGVAELVAGAISMGVGGYLSAATERAHYFTVRRHTQQRVGASCSRELHEEVQEVMLKYGVTDDVIDALNASLLSAEQRQAKANVDAPRWHKDDDDGIGMTPFLLHFGAGLEQISRWRVYSSAITIGTSYLLGGLVPLLPYVFCAHVYDALFISIAVTGFTLLIFGAVKQPLVDRMEARAANVKLVDSEAATSWQQRVAKAWPWRDSAYGALTTLAVGGAAAAASFGIVHAIESRMHNDV